MIVEIEISEEFLELYGSGTLIGAILNKTNNAWPTEVVLVFPQTTMGWRRENKGPKHYVMPEFAPMLLVFDVLDLTSRGIKVSLKTKDVR